MGARLSCAIYSTAAAPATAQRMRARVVRFIAAGTTSELYRRSRAGFEILLVWLMTPAGAAVPQGRSGPAKKIRPIVSALVSDPGCRDRFSRAVARAVGEAVDADTRNVLILDRGRPIELGVLARAADVRPKQRHL